MMIDDDDDGGGGGGGGNDIPWTNYVPSHLLSIFASISPFDPPRHPVSYRV